MDNKNLLDFWNNEGGKSIPLTNEIKDLFFMTLKPNIILNLHYVPSTFNNADAPSRFSSDIDCSLSDNAWSLVETLFGPHSFDMMAIPSNVKKSKNGEKLRFFSPHPVAESAGVNVFSQNLLSNENYYIFPPFVLIGSLINFFESHIIRVTLISSENFFSKGVVSICRIDLLLPYRFAFAHATFGYVFILFVFLLAILS